MKIGIDKIGFATARYVLNMDDLAESHNVDPDKYSKGLLLNNLSITPINDDIVTLGASAAESILSEEDKKTTNDIKGFVVSSKPIKDLLYIMNNSHTIGSKVFITCQNQSFATW